jgi:transcription initiation factor TFIIA large subunit
MEGYPVGDWAAAPAGEAANAAAAPSLKAQVLTLFKDSTKKAAGLILSAGDSPRSAHAAHGPPSPGLASSGSGSVRPAAGEGASAGGDGEGEADGDGEGDGSDSIDDAELDAALDAEEQKISDIDCPDLGWCLFDKVHRSKQKWRCTLRMGVVRIGGRDYYFQKANVEMEFQ